MKKPLQKLIAMLVATTVLVSAAGVYIRDVVQVLYGVNRSQKVEFYNVSQRTQTASAVLIKKL